MSNIYQYSFEFQIDLASTSSSYDCISMTSLHSMVSGHSTCVAGSPEIRYTLDSLSGKEMISAVQKDLSALFIALLFRWCNV